MRYYLDYDEGLVLHISGVDEQQFKLSSFYKFELKRYAQSFEGNKIIFKKSFTYLDYQKIIAVIEREANRKNDEFEISQELLQYINSKELYVESRSKLGIEIKNQEEKLLGKFQEYKSTVDSRMARKLRHKQMWDSFFMCAMRKSANFSVPGSGKTASVLGAYAYLKSKGIVKRIVVICPKNAFGSWIDEFSVCFAGYEKPEVFNIHNPKYKTIRERRNALLYDSGRANLILVNFEAVGSVLDALKSLVKSDTLLVFDEVHRVKRINGEYAVNSLELAEYADHTIAMTGTPIPNSYKDVYNLLHILFPNEYDTFFNFPVPMLANPNEEEKETINQKLQPFFCRTNKSELGVPPSDADEICCVTAGETECRIVEILSKKYRKNKLALFIRILQLESNPRLLLENLNLADFKYLLDEDCEIDEIDYADYSQQMKMLVDSCSRSPKMERCVDEIQRLVSYNKPVVVWCVFVDSIRQIAKKLEERGIASRCVFGEIPLEERTQFIADFKNGKFKVLITNPHTLAESVSLHSVCHDAVYFEYTYNLVHLLQSKDRIHRLGLSANQYTHYKFMQMEYNLPNGLWSMDEEIYNRLKLKEETMLIAIDSDLLETMPTTDEDLELIFSRL